jgi:alkylation response protein AidB-like acyl-CoA dehydrogenase
MDPRLNTAEKELRDRAREAAEAVKVAAAAIDEEDATPRALLTALGEAGVLGACVPQEFGGAGGGRVEAALVCEELGAASAGAAAIVIGHITAASLVESVGNQDQKRELLPAVAVGAKIATVALDGGVSLLEEPAVAVSATSAADELGLEGTAHAVAGAACADLLVVPAVADVGTIIGIVDAGSTGLTIGVSERKLGLNGSGMASVELSGAVARRLGADDAGPALATVRDLARIGHAAVCVGIGRAALEASTAYVVASDAGLDRAQSVQWMLADMATETEAARLLTWYAASRSGAGELREAAAMARLVAADAAVGASRRAVQIMGPAGNRRSAGVERLYRDAKAMEVHHGASESQRRAVARQLLPDLFEDAKRG